MKKLIYCALALAAGLFATSCMQENLEPVQEGNTVTFNVQLPDVATKASDAVAVDKLDYAVYRVVNGDYNTEELAKANLVANSQSYHLVYQERVDITNRDAISVNLDLMNDQRYVVLFWAQKGDTWFAEGTEFINISYPANEVAGNEVSREAFTGSAYIEVDGSVSKNIVLTRPFAQLNIATNLPSDRFSSFEVANTVVKVTGVATSFNVASQAANTPNNYLAIYTQAEPFKVTEDPLEYQKFGAYDCYLSMNYMFVPTDRTNVTVVYDIETNYGTVNNTITNVPIKKNYKTNIVGNLLTSDVDYNVSLENWATDGRENMEILNDGVVKNINGDYEIINANGLAYAINNLFADGGNFYLTPAEYEMAGYNVNRPTVGTGVELNIFGVIPVVTRSAVDGVIITGLKNSMIDVNMGAVSFTGIQIVGTNKTKPAFIETNEGHADFTSCVTESQSFVGTNSGSVTEADNSTSSDETPIVSENTEEAEVESLTKVATGEELVTALEAGNGVFFTQDIELEAKLSNAYGKTGINVLKGQTIDGNGHSLRVTGAGATWDSAISTTGGTIKNLNVAQGFRGIFVNHNSNHSEKVILKNVTVEGPTYTLNCDQGTQQNLEAKNCTFNGWTSYAKTIGEVLFEDCSFGKGAGYMFAVPYAPTTFVNCKFCIGYEMWLDAPVVFNACTLGSDALTAVNLPTLVQNYSNASIATSEGNAKVAVNAEDLQTLVSAADNTLIHLGTDINGDVTVIQKEGVKITIDGNGKKYDGSIKVHGNSNHYADAALTIKNVKFETSSTYIGQDGKTPCFNFIEALEFSNNERYSTNITVEDCAFTATKSSDAENLAVGLQIKSSKWAKVLNCTATNMHSLIQAQSCDETVVVNGCTINGKNGVAFKAVKAASVEGTTITATEYGVRFDGNQTNYGITVKNNNITANQPFIVRKMIAQNNTITLEGTNTLTTEAEYQVVITNGSDDEEYVKPTGTYTLTGADAYTVFPAQPKPNFADNTWDAIIGACQDNAVPTSWEVGDKKPMTIGGKEYQIAIIGKNHDDYTEGGKAPLTFQIAEIYGTTAKMNETQTNTTGWSGSAMRTDTMPAIISAMPSEVQNAIKAVNKKTLNGTRDGLETTSDKLFLLSEIEVNGSVFFSNNFEEGVRYAYYTDLNSMIMNSNGNPATWWLRGPGKSNAIGFTQINASGFMANGSAEYACGVVFGFCF